MLIIKGDAVKVSKGNGRFFIGIYILRLACTQITASCFYKSILCLSCIFWLVIVIFFLSYYDLF